MICIWEFENAVLPKFEIVAPNLILAGDIGRPDIATLQNFLLDQCQKFEHIFYVAGNHCFYEGEYYDRLEQLQQLNNLHTRIHFLHNTTYLLENNVRILGTTLWTHVAEQTAAEISRRLNDYYKIKILVEEHNGNRKALKRHRITVDDTNEWHSQQHAWLVQEIEKARENKEHVVIITHHPPVRRHTCSKEDEQSELLDAFVNDHDADCVDPVRLWFCGHTHKSTDLSINSTRIISNQLGYVGENCGFRPNLKTTLYEDGNITVTD